MSRSSKYDETFGDVNRICPYCKYKYQVEAEDLSENERVEECEECGKSFYAYDTFSVTHYAKPDCELNGGSHIDEKLYGPIGKYTRCIVCNKINSVTKPENGC